ncbi:ribitol-5-phosphate xylosyltransferase 1 [Polypterus senegalus]|uniref:ribitol-5-phosphate xylosyltransferase 1 n=1 Tax=Polypterus senegalus TaxID=55291 RepID=UPI0019633544|nr:ribitol-5-phosphate xylosyltransferase 1 [Polypterus senegalus]
MKITLRRVCICIALIYLAFSAYATYIVFFKTKAVNRIQRVTKKGKGSVPQTAGPNHLKDVLSVEDGEWNPWEEDEKKSTLSPKDQNVILKNIKDYPSEKKEQYFKVQIWGKAAIGLYLWEHILEGQLNPSDPTAQWRIGNLHLGKIHFSFYTGPSVVPKYLPLDSTFVVLVLNGREEQKISYAIQWLQHVKSLVQTRKILHVAVVLLGSEQCNNDWIRVYLRQNGGFIDLLFLVYDSPWVNGRDIFQWPLGVATYRGFPIVSPDNLLLNSERPYLCNFLGTIYKNSSRETLLSVMREKQLEKHCIIAAREEWLPQETSESLKRYQNSLMNSDLTLCPVGINTESYRIYEACSCGSVPVVEDIMTPGNCGNSALNQNPPLQLLKLMKAPFIFLKDWRTLPEVFEKEKKMSLQAKNIRRKKLVEWYNNFKHNLKELFTEKLEQTVFLKDSR